MKKVTLAFSLIVFISLLIMNGCKKQEGAFEWNPLHASISVENMDLSIKWYSYMLGFKLIKYNYVPQMKSKVAYLEHNGFFVELLQPDMCVRLPSDRRNPNRDLMTQGMKHIALSVKDINAVMNELKSKKVDVAADINLVEGDQVAFIRDPTGNLIELHQKK